MEGQQHDYAAKGPRFLLDLNEIPTPELMAAQDEETRRWKEACEKTEKDQDPEYATPKKPIIVSIPNAPLRVSTKRRMQEPVGLEPDDFAPERPKRTTRKPTIFNPATYEGLAKPKGKKTLAKRPTVGHMMPAKLRIKGLVSAYSS
jgi:hypothetical protein